MVTTAAFAAVLGLVSLFSLRASVLWRHAGVRTIETWGLGGRRLGTAAMWFLLGGTIYNRLHVRRRPGPGLRRRRARDVLRSPTRSSSI